MGRVAINPYSGVDAGNRRFGPSVTATPGRSAKPRERTPIHDGLPEPLSWRQEQALRMADQTDIDLDELVELRTQLDHAAEADEPQDS